MASPTRIIRKFYSDKAKADSRPLPTPSTRREPSKGELAEPYKNAEQKAMFCFHNIPMFQPCKKCRRDKFSAHCALARLCRSFNIAVQ